MLFAVQWEHPEWLWGLIGLPVLWVIALSDRALPSRRARVLCASMRCGTWAILAMALASPVYINQNPDEASVTFAFVTDRSLSIGESREDIRRHHPPYEAVLNPLGRIRHIEFARDAWLAGEPHAERLDGTNIGAGLRLAASDISQDGRSIILLFTDGRGTVGDPLREVSRLRAEGHTVHIVGMGTARTSGPRIVGVTPPSTARVGHPSRFLVHVRNEARSPFDLRLTDQNGIEIDHIASQDSHDSVFVLQCLPSEPGFQEYKVMITGADRHSARGDQTLVSAPVLVKGPPHLLLVSTIPEDTVYLSEALRNAGLQVSISSLSEMPSSPEGFLWYDAVVLSDCSHLDRTTQAHLERYVEQSGGGLVFIGGANVRTAEWQASLLEQVLPVSFTPERVHARQKPQSAHVCFVLDKSGSMSEELGSTAAGRATRLDMVKAAVHRSIVELPSDTMVSVIAFDGLPAVIVNAVPAGEWDRVADDVDRLSANGGTVMDIAVERAIGILDQGERRHMIVLTDGHTLLAVKEPALQRWNDLLSRIRKADIALTTVALGRDADRDLLAYLASDAGGITYECNDASEVPTVFIREAQTIGHTARMASDPFRPRPGKAADILRGLSTRVMPHLADAHSTEAKPFSRIVLQTEENTPLLAVWQYGLGTVVAFTSDAKPDWARRWITWDSYARFWHQVVTWALRSVNRIQAEVKPVVDGMNVQVMVRAVDDEGMPVQGLEARATLMSSVSSQAKQPTPFTWHEIRPGVYEGRLTLTDQGNQLCQLQLMSSDTCVFDHSFVVNPLGAPELAVTGPDSGMLESLASAGGGLLDPTPQDIVSALKINEQNSSPRIHRRALWPVLVLVLVFLWVMDVTTRRILSQQRRMDVA